MKKLILTSAIILGITLTTFADGGLFNRANNFKNGSSGYSVYFTTKDTGSEEVITPLLPNHGSDDNAAAPLGSGVAMLLGLGAAYAVAKKRNEK